jgi:hypothetical protein
LLLQGSGTNCNSFFDSASGCIARRKTSASRYKAQTLQRTFLKPDRSLRLSN